MSLIKDMQRCSLKAHSQSKQEKKKPALFGVILETDVVSMEGWVEDFLETRELGAGP